jgi:hypothetical protein
VVWWDQGERVLFFVLAGQLKGIEELLDKSNVARSVPARKRYWTTPTRYAYLNAHAEIPDVLLNTTVAITY